MTNIFFVAQKGSLELKARILAASLRKYCRGTFNIVACVPAGHSLSDSTMEFFKRIDVRILPFEPRLWREFDYPIGNKVDCAVEAGKLPGEYSIFLDTDMIVLREMEVERICTDDMGAAIIFGSQIFNSFAHQLLNFFLSTLPDHLRDQFIPYDSPIEWRAEAFNAGLIVFRQGEAAGIWRELVVATLQSSLPPKFISPFADQVALALMKRHRQLSFRALPRKWNCGVAFTNPMTVICHYHALLKAFDNDSALKTIRLLTGEFSTQSFSLLGEISAKDLYKLKRTPVAARRMAKTQPAQGDAPEQDLRTGHET